MVSDSLSRKLTLLTIPPFMVGWGFYVVGLVSELNVEDTRLTQTSKATPNFIPFYIALIGGPILIKIGLLHAALSGVVSAIFGAILSLLSTIYFSSVGAVTFTCVFSIYEAKASQSLKNGNVANIELMLMGLILQGVSWCFMLILSSSYVYQPEEERYDHSSTPSHPLTPKTARTFSTLFLLIATLSVCVFSSGLYHMSKLEQSNLNYFSFYTSIILLLIHLLALLNIGSTNRKISIATSVMTMVYLYILGDKVNLASIAKRECDQLIVFCSQRYIHAASHALGGGVVSLVFWGSSFALQPFYRKQHLTSRVKRWTIR